MAQAPTGFIPDGFEPDVGPNLSAVGGDTIRGEDPNAPSLRARLIESLTHAAQPESVGDFLSLIIPAGAGEAMTGMKDMARILKQATKESPTFRGILPRINQILKERPKTLQQAQSEGFNRLPLVQQMEHLPEVPAPPRAMPASLPKISAPIETPVVAARPDVPATAGVSAARTLTAEERQAVDALVQQGHAEADVLAELEKLRQPSGSKFTPSAVKLKMNAAETKEYLRLVKAGKPPEVAAELVKAQRAFVTGKGLQDTATVQQRIRERNASGRWEDAAPNPVSGPSQITPSQPPSIKNLIARKEAAVRSGTIAKDSILHMEIATENGMQSVGSIVADMQKAGTPQVQIDRWLQGLERSR